MTGYDPRRRDRRVTASARGFYLNPAAYAAPAPGRWGNAGRNSITRPAQFAERRHRADVPVGQPAQPRLAVDATNVLNRVTFAGVNTIVGSPQFGLPNRANPMRKLQTSLRLRF